MCFIRALLVASACISSVGLAADAYDAAVQNPARSEADRKRDALDRPAEVLRLAGIERGMRIADFLAGGGYYSELLSYIVGPEGVVLLLNDPSFERWSESAWKKRLAGNRLPNVKHRLIELNDPELGSGSLDALLMIKVYHDLYWEDPGGDWPKVNTASVLDHIVRALKPGGILLVVDHSAQAGRGSADASKLHRIEETFAIRDFEKRGMRLLSRSDILRNPEDPRTQNTYKGPMVGKTDRFVLVFRKGQES